MMIISRFSLSCEIITLHDFTTFINASTVAELTVLSFHNNTGFYAGFDISHESGIKYLLPDLLTKGKPKFLHTFCPVLWKWFFLIWQYLHGTIRDVDQVNQHFDFPSDCVTYSCITTRTFSVHNNSPRYSSEMCNTIMGWTAYAHSRSGLAAPFLPCAEYLHLLWKNRTEKQANPLSFQQKEWSPL